MDRAITAKSRSNTVAGVSGGTFVLIVACAPVGAGLTRALWFAVWFGAFVWAIVRAARMGVTADVNGLVVRNFLHDRYLSWGEVASVDAGASDNVSGAVTTIVICSVDGSRLVCRGASSYSRQTVERWRDELVAVRQVWVVQSGTSRPSSEPAPREFHLDESFWQADDSGSATGSPPGE